MPELRYQRIGLMVKEALQDKEETLSRFLTLLTSLGVEVFVDTATTKGTMCAKKIPSLSHDTGVDLLLVIGGDGTILRAIREWGAFGVPFLSVNRGGVGFLAEIDDHEAGTLLPEMLRGKGSVEDRSALQVQALRDDKEIFSSTAVNDAVISQGTISRLLDLRSTVGGEYLATYHADGLIVSTPTGSTAYSLAAGGPVVHPRLQALILTPINPHSFTLKPIVIPGQTVVDVEVVRKTVAYGDLAVSLTVDGQVYLPLEGGDVVRVTALPQAVRFLRKTEDTFYATIRQKLHWGDSGE